MGCFQSKVQVEASRSLTNIKSNLEEDSSGHGSEKFTSNGNSSLEVAPLPHFQASSSAASRQAQTATAAFQLELDLEWKLDTEELETMEANNFLQSLKGTTFDDYGYKSKVCLFDYKKVYFKAGTGAFSPAFDFPGTLMKIQYDGFQSTGKNELIVVEDCTKIPVVCEHPTVVQRPHVRAYAGYLLVSQDYHVLGTVIMYHTEAGRAITDDNQDQFFDLCLKAQNALQQGLRRGLRLPPQPESEDEKIELPAVWVDISDPEWKVFGINKEWEELTGVDLQTLTDFPGLLTVMQPSDGVASLDMHEDLTEAFTEFGPDVSLPILLSPRSIMYGSLQYAAGIQHTTSKLPLPTPTLAAVEPSNLCVVKVHARVQANTDGTHVDIVRDSASSAGDVGAGGSNSGGRRSSVDSFAPRSGSRAHNNSSSLSLGIQISGLPPRLASLSVGQMLGSGSYANVYSGYLGNLPVAVKVMNNSHGPESSTNDWIQHYEALLSVDVTHENIVATYDWCKVADMRGFQVIIVQELCNKGSVSSALKSGLFRKGKIPEGPPDLEAILQTARDVACGMQHLHSLDDIHADLSSNNILLAEADNKRGFIAKVTDFGLSRVAGGDATATVGTVSAMAPELLQQGLMIKPGDVFSFGTFLYEAWVGKRAWEGMSQAQIIFSVTCRRECIEMPSDAPKPLFDLATECMANNPEDRPTFDQILTRIDEMLQNL